MTEIRMKDKIFLAAVVPAAIAGLYWYCWRDPAAKREAEIERRLSVLVEEEDFPAEKARAARDLAAARAELAAEREIPMPQARVKGNPDASISEREMALFDIFAQFGVTILSGDTPRQPGDTPHPGVGTLPNSGGDSPRTLAACGVCPRPVLRVYVLDGKYPAVVKALEAVAARELAVIPDKASMRESGRGRWTMEVWL